MFGIIAEYLVVVMIVLSRKGAKALSGVWDDFRVLEVVMRRISRKDAKALSGVWDDFRVLEVVMRRISRKGAKALSGVWDNCGVFGGCDDSFITQRRKGAKGCLG